MNDILQAWYNADGDNTLRVDYPLTEDSIVWDVGGYKGEWAKKIYDRYKCDIVLFEPVYKLHLPGITVRNYGLGGSSRIEYVDKKNDATSLFYSGSDQMVIWDVADVDFSFIDLIKINIEGMEYELLNRLIELEQIKNLGDIQVQFHRFVPDADNLRSKITDTLKQTHIQTYCYDWVWENWKLK